MGEVTYVISKTFGVISFGQVVIAYWYKIFFKEKPLYKSKSFVHN